MSRNLAHTWIVLLRGVNVGGGNQVAMPALRASCEAAGFSDVASYIQSGNLVVGGGDGGATGGDGEAAVAERMRSLLVAEHGLRVPVVVRSATEWATVAERHPGLDSGVDSKFLHVQFLDRAAPPERTGVDPARFLPDTFTVAGRHVYLTYPNGSGRSKLTIEVFERAFGVTATARNLNTVRALADRAGV